MLKKTMTYKDLDGNPVTEDFYFNLTKAEIAELELSATGGSLHDHLTKIVEAEDGGEIIKTFKQIIMMAVGRRSEDGRRFIKTDEIRDEFAQTDAYSELFMSLVTNAEDGAAFIRGIVPVDLLEEFDKGQPVTDLKLPEQEEPAWIKENREPTQEEVKTMTPEQLRDAFMRKNAKTQ